MSKPWGRFFQILCSSQKVRTLTWTLIKAAKSRKEYNDLSTLIYWHLFEILLPLTDKLKSKVIFVVKTWISDNWIKKIFFGNFLKKKILTIVLSRTMYVLKLESYTVRIQMCVGVQVSCSHLGGQDKIGLGHFSPQRQR